MSQPTHLARAFDELASHYEETVDQELRKFWGIGYEAFVDQLIDQVGLDLSGSILDVATGTGLIPRKIVLTGEQQPARILGLDITFKALAHARQKAEAAWETAAVEGRAQMPGFVQASAHQLPFAPGSFDTVICALATHHLDQEKFLSAVWDVMKEGGQLVITDVAASPYWKLPGISWALRAAAFLYFLWTENPARAWVESEAVSQVYTVSEWKRALEKAGFTQIVSTNPKLKNGRALTAMLVMARKPVSYSYW